MCSGPRSIPTGDMVGAGLGIGVQVRAHARGAIAEPPTVGVVVRGHRVLEGDDMPHDVHGETSVQSVAGLAPCTTTVSADPAVQSAHRSPRRWWSGRRSTLPERHTDATAITAGPNAPHHRRTRASWWRGARREEVDAVRVRARSLVFRMRCMPAAHPACTYWHVVSTPQLPTMA